MSFSLETLAVSPILAVGDELQHEPGRLRERAEELLSRPPYVEAEAGPLARLWQQATEFVGDRIARTLDALLRAIWETGTAGAWTIVAIGGALLILLVWRLTRGMTADRRAVEVPGSTPRRSANSWAAEARRHEAAGELRDALRCRYAAIVVGLIEAGVIEDVPGRTIRELDAEVAIAAPTLAPDLAAVGRRYEAVVYGGEPATREDLEAAARAAERRVVAT